MREQFGGATVERLYFGREDAERDMADGLLSRGFQRTAAYDAVVSGRKMLVIGRKGSGKSAICMRLSAGGEHSGSTVLITPDDAAGDEIRRFELQGLTGDMAKSLIWRYVFAVHAARYVVGHAREEHGRRRPASVKALRRFLRANQELPQGASPPGGRLDDRLGDRLTQAAQGLQTSLSLEAFGARAQVDMGRSPSEGSRASRQLEVVERGVAAAFRDLGCAAAHEPLLLLVDQLEQVWSPERESNSMVIGLLLAAKHVSGAYAGALNCLLFLRSDIYDSLSFGEGDKFRGDELRIGWSGAALEELVLSRARASVGSGLTAEGLWRGLFPETVRGEDPAAYLFTRALPRPRDVIQYLNLCRDTAVGNGHSRRIEEEDVLLATRQFSEWKLKDLVQEYLVAHPFLERLFPLFQNTGYVVTRTALESRFAQAAPTLHAQYPAYEEALTLPGIVDTLYGVGFLGVRRGSDVIYAGGMHLPVEPHESEFHIHPCFREALGAASAVDIHAYEPLVEAGIRSQVASGNMGYLSQGNTRTSRRFALLQQLERSCRSVLQQTGRADGLPLETRGAIVTQVRRVQRDASAALTRLSEGGHVEVYEHLDAAANYFTTLAAQLLHSGLDDGNGVGSVVRRIEDEAAALMRSEGGLQGSSGNSSGY